MNNAPKLGKRIVSKGRFALNTGKMLALTWLGIGIIGVGIVALLYCILTSQLLMANTKHLTGMCMLLFTAAMLIICPLMLIYYGVDAVKTAKQIDIGVPFTRANTADLPAPDSLVRASQEPAQAREDVLLRASTETHDKHEEQLLRAAREQ